MQTRITSKFHPARFVGVGVINPFGIERERRIIHPNATSVWSGRLNKNK